MSTQDRTRLRHRVPGRLQVHDRGGRYLAEHPRPPRAATPETAWSEAVSGCSSYDAKPTWQSDSGCAKRTVADVSAVADPDTGVTVSGSYGSATGWMVLGGTSASAALIAATYALAGAPSAGSYPSSFPYARTSSLYDVSGGSNGSCSSRKKYLCTPHGGDRVHGLSPLPRPAGSIR